MKTELLLVPTQVAESVTVVPLPNCEERSSVSYVDFVAMKRFHEEVRFEPRLTPVCYRDTVVCYINSSKKRYISQTLFEPRNKPSKFAEKMVIYPKRPERSFVTFLDYHIDACRKWFKTSLEFKARTFTTHKIIPKKGRDENENVREVDENTGPGASQVYIPFGKEQKGQKTLPQQVGILSNGY